jgi:hypothetical protein
MVCAVCRMEYLTAHNCPGLTTASAEAGTAPPPGFALFYYLKEAWRIVCWDDAAIRRIAADSRALPYGLLVWALTNLVVIVSVATFLEVSGRTGHFELWRFILGAVGSLPIAACMGLLHLGICHLCAKWFSAGEGHLLNLVRPLILATIVYVLVLVPIPIFGVLLVQIAWIAVVTMVFQEVHGMEPLTAFLLSAAVGIAIRAVEYLIAARIL